MALCIMLAMHYSNICIEQSNIDPTLKSFGHFVSFAETCHHSRLSPKELGLMQAWCLQEAQMLWYYYIKGIMYPDNIPY